MDRPCVVFVLLFGLVFCDDPELARSLNNSNPNFWDQYEIVTQPPLQDLSALENCGEGDQQGKFLCVPYYNCDAKTDEITSTEVYDNRTLVNLRFDDTDRKCEHYLDKCCKIPAGGLPNSSGNQNRPIGNQNRPTGNQSNPNGNQNRPNGNQNRPDENQNRPKGNQNSTVIEFKIDPPSTSRPITSPPITSRPITSRPITSRPTISRPVTSRPNQPSMRGPATNPGTFLCGIRNKNGIDFQITGNSDNEAEFGEFPWMVALLEKNDDPSVQVSFCGGSLLGANIVLTAAHCVINRKADTIKVRAGEWDSQTTKERIPFQERDVRRIIMHEDFNKGALFNDVAILILNRGLSKVESIGPICLPDQDQHFNSVRCIATGWGKDKFGKAGQYATILKKIEMPLVHREDCERALRTTRLSSRFLLNRSFICAGGDRDVDTCTGDGGSPLVCQSPNNPNRYVQVGIVSWGIGCGDDGIPGVYADVTQFRSWIDEKLQQASIGSESYTIDE